MPRRMSAWLAPAPRNDRPVEPPSNGVPGPASAPLLPYKGVLAGRIRLLERCRPSVLQGEREDHVRKFLRAEPVRLPGDETLERTARRPDGECAVRTQHDVHRPSARRPVASQVLAQRGHRGERGGYT